MSDSLKAWLECSHCDGTGAGQVQTPWKTNPCEHCDGGGGREVLLTPTDDIDTERIYAEAVARYVETVGDAVDAAVQARKRLKAAVGTTWTIKETDDGD